MQALQITMIWLLNFNINPRLNSPLVPTLRSLRLTIGPSPVATNIKRSSWKSLN